MAVWYCDQVVKGHVNACRWEILACQRFLKMRSAAIARKADFRWSDAHLVDVCSFIEKLPHTSSVEGLIVLEPCQMFWLAGIFAFREAKTGLRWVSNASIWIPRKNTKTTIAVGIVLFCCNCEGEVGAQAVISAASEDQANIPYGAIRRTLAMDDDLRDHFQAHDVREGTTFGATGGSIRLALSRAKNLDGLNPHLILAEELHAQSQDVIGVLRTAQAARRQPLEITLSTAGRDIGAAAYEDWKHCQAVLEGTKADPRRFVVLYAGDEHDEHNRFDLRVIEKLNPMYGTALDINAINREIIEARISEPKLQEFLRTRINRWRRAAGNLISMDAWHRCADESLNLDLFKGFPMYVGLDLASRQDLNAAQFIVRVDKTLFTAGLYWLCENSPRFKDDRYRETFLGWAHQGHMRLTPGAHINYKMILADLFEVLDGHNVMAVGIDDYQGNLMATEIEEAGHPVVLVRKNAKHLTQSTEDIIARVNDPELFQHDANPVTAWCAGNVCGYWDHNDNVLPKKERRNSGDNIDGMDALIVANALRLDDDAGHLGMSDRKRELPNPYLERGLIGWDH